MVLQDRRPNLLLTHSESIKWPRVGESDLVPDYLVRIAFSLETFIRPTGLYLRGLAHTMDSFDRVSMRGNASRMAFENPKGKGEADGEKRFERCSSQWSILWLKF